jgi:uncharacterized membrane protein
MQFNVARSTLPVFLVLLLLFETATYLSFTPRYQERFFQLYALGSNGTVENYFPDNQSLLSIGESIRWHIGVVNDMGLTQLVSIQVKLGNETIRPPNDTLGKPSSAPFVTQFERFLQANETWEFPFYWQILNATSNGRSSRIEELQINNSTYTLENPPTCIASGPCAFRIIFELWTWDVNIANFQIGWQSSGKTQIAWLQLWFSVKPGTQVITQ